MRSIGIVSRALALLFWLAVFWCTAALFESGQAQQLSARFDHYAAESLRISFDRSKEKNPDQKRTFLSILPSATLVSSAEAEWSTLPVLLGGIAGSGLGVWGGIEAGEWASDHWGFDCCGDDPGQLARIIGALTFSVTGTMLGTTAGNALAGQPPVPLLRRLRDAMVGLGVGSVAFVLTSRVTTGSTAPLVAYSIGQGIYAGLSNGRW